MAVKKCLHVGGHTEKTKQKHTSEAQKAISA